MSCCVVNMITDSGLFGLCQGQLTLMLLVTNVAYTERCKKKRKMTETLANRYSCDSTQRGLSNEYQHNMFR